MSGQNLQGLLDSVGEAGTESEKQASIEKMSEDEIADQLNEEFKDQGVEKLADALEEVAAFDEELEAVRPLQKMAELASVAGILNDEGVLSDGVNQNGTSASQDSC